MRIHGNSLSIFYIRNDITVVNILKYTKNGKEKPFTVLSILSACFYESVFADAVIFF